MAPILNGVAFPAFALLQRKPKQPRFYALKAPRTIAALAVPVFFGISVTAPETVALVFGSHWTAARGAVAGDRDPRGADPDPELPARDRRRASAVLVHRLGGADLPAGDPDWLRLA